MMLGEDFQIYLRNAQYGRIDRLDIWTKLTCIKRFNGVGTWNLEIPTSARIAQYVNEHTGIIIQFQGTTIFSGPGGGEFEEDNYTISASGTDDNVLLETLARPTPSLAQGPYPDDYDVTTGTASTIMRSLVDRNIGPSAPTEWKIPQLTIDSDPLLGSTITARARFDPLITLLGELASTPIATGLGFEILQSNNLSDSLLFYIYSPQDKRESAVFSVALHTANDYRRVHTNPSANWFVVAGGDQFGLNRMLVEGGDEDNIALVGRRISAFVDRRGVTNLSELEQELAELIAGAVTIETITVDPTDAPSLQYFTHYRLGDIVTVVVKGVSYVRLIREIEFDFVPRSGVIIRPTIADPFGTNDTINAQHVSTLQHRLSNIERNFAVPDDSIIEDMLHPTMKWYPGDFKETGRAAAQPGWLLCDGSAISRSTYSRLFSAIGTLYGPGNGTTTFNIPSTIDKYKIGAGPNHALGSSAGSTTINIAHAHTHSHGLNNHTHSGASHTHPQSHSHGLVAHEHQHTHAHPVADSHDHGGNTGFPNESDSVESGSNFSVPEDLHWHDIPTDNMSVNTDNANVTFTTEGKLASNHSTNFDTTQSDSNVGSASYSGSSGVPSINSTESDSASGGGTPSFDPPNVAVNVEIYTGLIPV